MKTIRILALILFASGTISGGTAAACEFNPTLNVLGAHSADPTEFGVFCDWVSEINRAGMLPIVVLDELPDCPRGGDPTWECNPTWQLTAKGSVTINGISESEMFAKEITGTGFSEASRILPDLTGSEIVGIGDDISDLSIGRDEIERLRSTIGPLSDKILVDENLAEKIDGSALYFLTISP